MRQITAHGQPCDVADGGPMMRFDGPADPLPMPLPAFVCDHCGFWQRLFEPPTTCPLCLDARRGVPRDGWRFHDDERAAALYPCRWAEVEPGLWRFWNERGAAPAPHGTLIVTGAGNVMFEGCTHYGDAALAQIAALGGVRVLAASHPPAYGALWQIQDHFDPDLALHTNDLRWWGALRVTWPYDEPLTPMPGLTLHLLAGPSEGHAVLHDEGRRILFSGGALHVETAPDDPRKAVAIGAAMSTDRGMPLTPRALRRYRKTLGALAFRQVWTPWQVIHNVGRREALALVDRLSAGRPHVEPVPLADLGKA